VRRFRFSPALPWRPAFTAGDGLILLGIIALLYVGARLAFAVPPVIAGPQISTSPLALPWYAALSVGRMTVAYFLSLAFSLAYGSAAARNRGARIVLMPLLDVLQSVPILAFLPMVLLSLSAVLPRGFASELTAVILIFTSQAWNMTFSFYQSQSTTPTDLREAAAVFRLDPWQRFKTLDLPFSAIGLIWNSMMSWAGGWFFLMAAEFFKVGSRDFRLPGLGSYLQTAANNRDYRASLLGLATLVIIIVLMDQLVWRPILAWADKFKLEMVEGDEPPTSWFLEALSRSWMVGRLAARWEPTVERIDAWLHRRAGRQIECPDPTESKPRLSRFAIGLLVAASGGALYGASQAAGMLLKVSADEWARLALGLLATFGRVSVSILIALLWTVPVGVLIGGNRRVASVLQPVVQTVASIPATAVFPMLVSILLLVPGGLNLAAVLLMLLGTQWYLLFNVIAGASAIPLDLRYTTALLRLGSMDRWKTLILPALFPYIVTGALTASGGAWNASIVAEYSEYGGRQSTTGVGALISEATAAGNYPLLLAGTLSLILTVITINRSFWRRLYVLAERRYRLD